ncbi:MAG: (2Fe-2S) ferredoxin domain-containing protein [Pseudomonadota bacterium]|nr:(2Fe-2S) ferredoxin domain-containing protein [Pseudomonadota bacterium]
MAKPHKHVFVCVQSRPPGHPKGACGGRGSPALVQAFADELNRRGLWDRIALTGTGCLGPCGGGPNVLVYPEGLLYHGVQAADVPTLVSEHLLADRPVARLLAPAEVW